MTQTEKANTSRMIRIGIGPVLFLSVLLFLNPDPDHPAVGRTLAVAALMAYYWLSDAIPMAATALFPVVLLPLLGVMESKAVAPLYVNDIIFLFIGGFLLALAMEAWNLHRRIAMRIILALGRSPGWLLFGFMAASWFLSGWVSNTATALMMVPIVMALASRFEETAGEAARPLTVCLLLGVAYASSIGGMATLIGTPPNLSLARIFTQTFPDAPPIGFLRWMAFAGPLSIVLLVLIFAWLRRVVLGNRSVAVDRHLVREEYATLGGMSREEKIVFYAFCAFVLLIVTRADVTLGNTVVRGWASRLGVEKYVGDGTVSVGVAVVLFLIPTRRRGGFILSGETVNRLPWDIIILLGGGFALARAFQVSGLSAWLGGRLAALEGVHPLVLIGSVCAMITFLTELTSNTATTQVVLPIIASMCVALGIDPLLLMVPVTITASCAFMLPVATPPNAIVFGTHRLTIGQMARTGLALNIIGIVIVSLSMYFFGRYVFGIDLTHPPTWM